MGLEDDHYYEIWWKTRDGKLHCVVAGPMEGRERVRRRLWNAILPHGPEAISWAGIKRIRSDGTEEVLVRGQRQALPHRDGDHPELRRWGKWDWRYPARARRAIGQP